MVAKPRRECHSALLVAAALFVAPFLPCNAQYEAPKFDSVTTVNNLGPRWRWFANDGPLLGRYIYPFAVSERPSANIPWPVVQDLKLEGAACNQSAIYVNVSCKNPPEQVSVTWNIQSILVIDTANQFMRLNTYLKVEWKDWRLSYTEGGISCWSAVAEVLLAPLQPVDMNASSPLLPLKQKPVLTSSDISQVQSDMQAALEAIWQCQTLAAVARAENVVCLSLPPGLWPSVNVTIVGVDLLRFVVDPAVPTSLQSQASSAISKSLARLGLAPDFRYSDMTGLFSTEIVWKRAPKECSGGRARRMPSYLILNEHRQMDTPTLYNPAGDYLQTFPPSSLSPLAFWQPVFEDSISQVATSVTILDQWMLYPDGKVLHQTHFTSDFSVFMDLRHYPFDRHYFVATRRPRAQFRDRVRIAVNSSSFTLPVGMEEWSVRSIGSLICPRHEAAGADPSDCDQPGAAPCQDIFVMYFQADRKPNYFLQNQLAPIVLITVLSAASYYNDMAAYDARMAVMASSLLSMMALQAYVSAALPLTPTVTFVHFALYSSYSLMGVGIGVIVLCAYGLREDIVIINRKTGEVSHKHMREYFHELAGIKKFFTVGLRTPTPLPKLVYFADVIGDGKAELILERMRDLFGVDYAPLVPTRVASVGSLDDAAEAGDNPPGLPTAGSGVVSRRVSGLKKIVGELGKGTGEEGSAGDDKTGRKSIYDYAPDLEMAEFKLQRRLRLLLEEFHCHLPMYLLLEPDAPRKQIILSRLQIPARKIIMEIDWGMRLGHMLIFGIVLLVRYLEALAAQPDFPTCGNMLTFFNREIYNNFHGDAD